MPIPRPRRRPTRDRRAFRPSIPRAARGLALVALAAGVLAACGDSGQGTGGSAALRVVATTTVVTDFARVVGGDRVDVYGVLKPNVDPHDFEPAPADLDRMAKADVIVENGVGLESWLAGTIKASGSTATLVDASSGITIRAGGHGDEEPAGHADDHAGEGDPHIWHDPRNAEQMVRTIAAAFAAADPDGAATYQQNLDAYVTQLRALDTEIAGEVATLPDRTLVTNHDAFGYFIDRYGFTFVGSIIPSFDTSAELSAGELRDLVAAIRSQGVKAVFSEASLPGKTAKAIADEAGVRVVAGDDALYGDGLGPAGSDGATYLEMMRHNASTIVTNLR